ncbi:hypothetical protein [Halomarina pelagica]|uniref:hypothetical protein n=1 Tax=Halomarina pelagica TaxID=2961599 RepID=UPI0020C2A8DC|nr:hypothetical protein [Halomarina sp. BND7]
MSRFNTQIREALATASDLVDRGRAVVPRTGTRRSGAYHRRRVADRTPPPRGEIERYWRQYRSVPLLRAPINQFADDVVEHGYRVTADDNDTQAFLEEWCASAAVLNGERGRDLGDLLHQVPKQAKAKGSALIEHAPLDTDPETIGGLALIAPETITYYTRPDMDLLVQPDDTDLEHVKLTEDGEAAAYVQYDTRHYSGDETENRLTADDVTKIVNDPDVGDIFGLSAIEPVSPRVEGVRKKLQDNEQAIESMAYGQWFFAFKPTVVDDTLVEWDEDAIDDVMDEIEDVRPGDQIGLDGDIDVTNVPGEVADILGNLEFDVNYILSAMPAPTYAVGFEENINQFVVDGQETRHETRVEQFRQRLAAALTPVLRTVAEQHGYDPAGVRLALEPAEETSPVLALTDEEMDRLQQYADAVEKLSGAADPSVLVDQETLLDLVLQLPKDAAASDLADVDALDLPTLDGAGADAGEGASASASAEETDAPAQGDAPADD